MRIKKIDLVGFKSFCDKTSIQFTDNLTAIVGPNGCGKSNVVDALRWVMGAKSAKQLRGQTMEDVIFAGTESRGPMGMAEVTFTLDLRDGVSPSQYSEYDEVAVTRRLHRDGTSEYFIQKVPVRLQDIRELFLGTGVGHYAYAIIEQGRVGEIVSSRPETRRQFIEEAAGITRYKEKKHKAVLKMDATRQNLLRITDIVTELETSMRRLWRAAKKAERYEDCRDEVADLEKWQLAQRLLENLGRSGLSRTELDELKDLLTELDATMAEREARVAAGRLELRDLEVELSDRHTEAAALDNRVKLLEAQVDHKRREISELSRRSALDAAEARRLDEAICRHEADLVATREALQAIGQEYTERRERLQEQEQALRQARQSQVELDARVEELRQLCSRTDARIAGLESDRRSGAFRLEEATVRLEQLQQEQSGFRARREGLVPVIETLSGRVAAGQAENAARHARSEELLGRRGISKDRISRLEVELDTVRGQLQRNQSRLSSLGEIQRRYEGFQRGTRAIMENIGAVSSQEDIHGILADVVQAPAEYEAAVEAVLGERLGAILVSDSGVSVEAVEYLKEGNLGRSTFLPVSAMRETESGFESQSGAGDTEITDPRIRGMILDLVKVSGEFSDVAGQLLEGVLVVDNLEQALKVWHSQKRPRTVVTLDGEVVDPLGIVTGGSADASGASVLAQKREIRELEDICADLQKHHDRLHEELVTTKQDSLKVEQEIEELRRAIHEAEMSLLGSSKDLDASRDQLAECEQRLANAVEEGNTLARSIAELGQRRAEWSTELEQLTNERAVSTEQLELGFRDASADRQRVDALNHEVGELKVTVARAAEKRNTSQRELARLEQDLKSDRERLVTLHSTAALNGERVTVLEREIADGDEARLKLSSEAMDLGERVAEESEVCERRRSELDELEASLKSHRDQRRELAERREAAKMSLLELAKDWEHLADRLLERHHTTAQEVLHDFHLRPMFDDELQNRLARQSKVLDSLRNTYHPGARQEYDELSERHSFLSEQKQDLEDALDRLDKAIQKINRTSRARFRAAFEGINEQFQTVFPRLFKGGRARLELTQSNDVLNAGVDIVARPPGKKLQSVDLLSGGEKALTAVALLFAIFRYKPSPFCLLDEVDAPLDDMNVDRFNEMVREMAQETQFVLITHNKRTMALTDSLYGVTMEQAGCSKVVSVSFREASEIVDEDPPGSHPSPDPAASSEGGPAAESRAVPAPPSRPVTPESAAS
ncbi:MAG: chromosome segregation protein SMC [bacterium]